MRSKFAAGALALSLVELAGCGGGNMASGTGIKPKNVGAAPTFYVSASNSTAVGDDEVIAVDTQSLRMHRLSLAPFAVASSTKLPFAAKEQNVVAADDGAYSIVIAGGDYAVVKRSGATLKNPIGVAGRITGVAYDPKSHHLALFDDLGSTAALVLSAAGDVTSSWVFGPVIVDADRQMTAAAMLEGGRLVLSLNGSELAVADLDRSIAAKSWQVRRFPVEGLTEMSWLAGVTGAPHLVMVQAKDVVAVVDVDAQEITDQRNVMAQKVLGSYRNGTPSVVTSDGDLGAGGATKVSIHFVDANVRLQSIQVILQGTGTPSQAVVDPVHGFMTFQVGQWVQRYRLSDSLVVSETKTPVGARVLLAPQAILVFQDSELGSVQRLDYARDANAQTLELFNLRALISER